MAESYLKDAFLMKPNLVGLGAGVVVACDTLWRYLRREGMEGAFLWTMSRNPRFQRMMRSRRGP